MLKKLVSKEKIDSVKANSAQFIVGKGGLTENLLLTIKKKLNKEKIIKIKILKTALDSKDIGRKEFAELIAQQLGANLIEIRGYTIILQKE